MIGMNEPDYMTDLTEARPKIQLPKAETFAARHGADLGTDPNALLQSYRDQVDTVHEASVAVARIKADLARLSAEYGARGQSSHADHLRKALLASLMEAKRLEVAAEGGKITEAALDSYARAHHDYRAFLDKGRRELEEYEHRQADLSEAFATLEREKGVLAYLQARLEVFRTLSFAWGNEARLTPNT